MFVSTGIHTILLGICVLVTCNHQGFEGSGDEGRLGEFPSEQLTDAAEENMSVDTTEAITPSESSETLDVEVIVSEDTNGTASLSETLKSIKSSAGSDSDSELRGDLSQLKLDVICANLRRANEYWSAYREDLESIVARIGYREC